MQNTVLSNNLKQKGKSEADLGKKLQTSSGTIEFWLSEIEWNNPHVGYEIFNIPLERGEILLVKNLENQLECQLKVEHKTLRVSADVSNFENDSKHHIAITWTTNELKLYLDGKLAASSRSVN